MGEWKYSSTHSLISALDGGGWSASRLCRFTPKETATGTHWIGGWVGPRAVLDAVVRRKIPSSRRESNPRIPIVQHIAQRYTDWLYPKSVFLPQSDVYIYIYIYSFIFYEDDYYNICCAFFEDIL
jgi:hypothetical protein